MIVALVIGTLLALAALAFVLYPLFVGVANPSRQRDGLGADGTARTAASAAVVEDPVDALREIEFDRATGKLSDHDYGTLKTRYTERALAEMRARESAAAAAELSPEDAAEAAILRQRTALMSCPSCGPRPEPDAAYCSDCGRYLPGRCGGCGAEIDEPGARYCAECGSALAA